MSTIEIEKVYEYFSSVNEARDYVNKRIENLIQILEKRKSFLNCELDGLEYKIKEEYTKGREILEKLMKYEESTIDLFGNSEHLSSIQSRINKVESELSRKKIKLEWLETVLETQLESLGDVAYFLAQGPSSSTVYENIVIPNIKPPMQISISDEGYVKTCPNESLEKYENTILKTESLLTKLNCSGSKPPRKSKKPVISSEFYGRKNSSGQSKSSNQPGFQNKSDNDYDDIVYEDTISSGESSTACQKERNIEYYFYKEQSQLEAALTGNLKRSHSYSGAKRHLIDSDSTQYSSSVYEEGVTNLDYETMDNVQGADEDPWEREYEEINEAVLIDMTTAKSKLEEKLPPYVKAKKSSTLGRVKSKKKFDLPQVAKCSKGSAVGELDRPKAICISKSGNIFVAEKGNNRVQVFSSEGTHLLSFGEKSGPNKMVEPNGICIYREFVFVTLTNQNLVQQYTAQGGFIKQKGKKGSEEGMFKLPTGIDGDDSRGRLYICDTGNNRVQIFDSSIRFIKILHTNSLLKPLDIKVINNGNLIVLDRSPKCIHFFDSSGELLKEIINSSAHLYLVNPLYFAISREGNIILSDYSKDCIHIFTGEGEHIWTLGEAWAGTPLVEPRGMACDKNGRLVTVCNKNKEMLQIFKI